MLQLNLYLVLLPLDGQSVPKLERPYLSCLPTLSVQHLCQVWFHKLVVGLENLVYQMNKHCAPASFQFVALQLSRQPKEVEIYIRKNMDACLSANDSRKYEMKPDQSNGLERLWEEKTLLDLYPFLATRQGDLVFSISK